nr:MAG: hypothetical protein DIU60_25320 [Actinomycetota bacterium]
MIGGAATAAGAVATVLRSAHLAHPPGALLYRLMCTLGAGGWITYTLASGELWSQGTWAALGIGALTAGVLSPLGSVRRGRALPGRSLVLTRTARVGQEWEARVYRCCRLRVQVTQVQEWPTGTGYDVHVELPGGGATRAQIAAAADALAADAQLPEGCGVEVSPGEHRGAAILRVATVNRLHEAIPYPADYRTRSILDPVPIGEYRDGSTAAVLLRESSALITGQKGSGKTTLLHALTAGVGLCRDAIVWHIDLNGGGMSQPWLHPWLEGRTDRPAVDWAAGTPEDALDLAAAALRIAKARKRYTRALKVERNVSLMPVSPSLPEIVVVVDEGAEALSPMTRDPVLRRLRETIEEIQRIGRNEAVNVIVSSLRATQDMISPNVRKQSAVRVGMYVQDDEELAFLFGWNKGLSAADLPTKGCGFVQDGQATPRPFKGYAVQPADIVEAAAAIARSRPELDEAAAEVAGEAYATRHERMRSMFGDEPHGEIGRGDEAPAAAVEVPRPRLSVIHGGRAQQPAPAVNLAAAAEWPDLHEVAAAARTPRLAVAAEWPDLTPGRTADAPTQASAGLRLAAADERPALDAPTEQIPDILARVLEVFAAAGDDRMHSEALAAALGTTPVELAAALRPYGVSTLPNPFERGGRRARGYALADVEAAAARHAAD